MKKDASPNGRKHGLRSRLALESESRNRTILTFASEARTYLWSSDRARRFVVKH